MQDLIETYQDVIVPVFTIAATFVLFGSICLQYRQAIETILAALLYR